jgi:hypothetical protein
VVFRLQSLSCGYYEYANGKLIYSPESRWETNGGQAKFAKRMLIIEFENSGGKKRVEIPYRIVEAMAVSTQHRTFTITLWEVPKFFDVVNPVIIEMMASLSLHHQKTLTPRSRLTGLSDGTSRHLAIGQSLVYQISLSPDGFDEMTRKLYERNVLPIYRHNVPTPPLHKRRSLADGLKQLSKSIQDCSDGSNIIPFGVLYQMEALVRNGYLLPWTVQGVLNNMVRFSKDIKASSKPKVRYLPSFHFPALLISSRRISRFLLVQ